MGLWDSEEVKFILTELHREPQLCIFLSMLEQQRGLWETQEHDAKNKHYRNAPDVSAVIYVQLICNKNNVFMEAYGANQIMFLLG